jgi:hypothetical protein
MNLNPFNFQQTPQWGSAAEKHLKNMSEGHKSEASNGKSPSKAYEGKPADAEQIIETSRPSDIRRWMQMPAGERGSLTL